MFFSKPSYIYAPTSTSLDSQQIFCTLLPPGTIQQISNPVTTLHLCHPYTHPTYAELSCAQLVFFTCQCCSLTSASTLSTHVFFPLGTDPHPYTHGSTARSRCTFCHLCTMYLPPRARSGSYNHPRRVPARLRLTWTTGGLTSLAQPRLLTPTGSHHGPGPATVGTSPSG